MLRLRNIKIRENLDEDQVIKRACRKYNIDFDEVKNAYIYKKSIDARNKQDIFFSYTVDIELKASREVKGAVEVEDSSVEKIIVKRNSKYSPVIIGSGPAGLFAALTLVENGINPIIIEQGERIEDRVNSIEEFKKNGKLNIASNIQFGEGGAGAFSDGKLTTGANSVYNRKVLEEFVKYGAPKEILYIAKPHIGTDYLITVVKNIREYVESKGGKYMFSTKVIDFTFNDGEITKIGTTNGSIETDTVILAIGHSARDTFKKLFDLGVEMRAKNFAVGVRIEHLQENINNSQYSKDTKLKLPSAEYKLVYKAKNGRTCYTFCMCPGGQVMASSSEEGIVVTNGMSYFARDGENANSALLVNVTDEDFENGTPLGGMYFQEELEKKAYVLGGKNYYAPVQRVEDFLKNRKTEKLGKIKPTYLPGVTFSNLNDILPKFITTTLSEGLNALNGKLKGFADPDAILTGVETRTSSPVQIVRDNEELVSNIKGLYPCGEGAGYAGGIMTAAIDGIKIAKRVLET